MPAIVACALPAVASAHAYLVGSDPAAGARLDSSPTRAILRFNEAFVRGSAGVSLRRTDGTRVTLPPGLEMTAAAHFMRQVYSGFDEPVSIVPPRSP